jgi:hypothetical protein
MLNTDAYTSRYFNVIKDKDGVITKSSTHIEKINNEYKYYYYLPHELKKYFVKPYDFSIENNVASYKMQKINEKNAGEMLCLSKINEESFIKLLSKILLFQTECIVSGEIRECTTKDSYYLVIQKTKERIKDNKELLNMLSRIELAYRFYIKERKTWNKIISHGDLCLSNMFWVEEQDMFLLIDPRGADIPEHLYMDEYYDLAKLSHSILGGYDCILYKQHKCLTNYLIKDIFIDFIKTKNISINFLRVYEASLFLSMIPLHADNLNNIDLFKNSCDKILKEIGF